MTRPLLVYVGLKFKRAGMQISRWMCGISMKDRRTHEELRRLVRVEPKANVISWVKKCMEFRVEGLRPGKTWLKSVEADMA